MDDQELLTVALAAAREAGALARTRLGEPGYLRWKGLRELVTGSVLEVQDLLVDRLRTAFPQHAILAEESSAAPAPDTEALWIIDPIDGTLNFAQGIPHFAICLGFRYRDTYRLGVVYDPCRDELFHAVRDRGAFLNGQPIVVEQVREGVEAYQRAVIGTDWPANLERRKEALLITRLLNVEVLNVSAMGAPALGLCYVGAGRLHAYFHLDLQLWDVAAAAVIVEEAGGVLTNAVGGSWRYTDGGYLASNGVIHGWMLRSILPVLNMRQKLPPEAQAGTLPPAGPELPVEE
jgi:myo-inositol-1(or 4)-monophosphatase